MSESIKIPNENIFLEGKVYKPSDNGLQHPVVLMIHGWEGAQNRFAETAELLANKGFVVVTFDMRGHGESKGDRQALSPRDFLNDVLAAYDYAAQIPNIDPKNIYMLGSSFGSYLGAILSSLRKVKGLALRVPANYQDEGFDRPKVKTSEDPGIMEWRSQPVDYQSNKALNALHNFPGSILIVESGNDDQVPHQTVQNYVDAVKDKARLTYVVMANAPHSLKGHPEFIEEMNQILLKWLPMT